MHRLRRPAAAEARRLLRVLLLRDGAVPAAAGERRLLPAGDRRGPADRGELIAPPPPFRRPARFPGAADRRARLGSCVMRSVVSLLLGAGLCAAAPAAAADLALVIEADPAATLGAEAGLLGASLAARGYEVHARTSASRAAMAEVIGEVEARLPEADRLVLVYAGRTARAWGRTWLLPADFDGTGRVATAFGAVGLDVMLDLAAERPGRAAVVIASDPATAAPGPRNPVPQGVLVIAGGAEAAIDATTTRLLAADRTAAQALAGLDGVTVAGFRPPDMGFGVVTAERPAPRELVTPQEAAAAEEALGLDQAARLRIQQDLTVLGYNTRGIDGIFGEGTRAAVASWQASQGLASTGYFLQAQVALLRAAADARSAELAAAAEQARRQEAAADAAFWRATGANGAAADLRAYLARYPEGKYAPEATAALDRLEAAAREAAAAEDRAAWEGAQAQDTVTAYRRYLDTYPDGAFAGQAGARIEALEAAPREAALRAEAEARETELGLNRASRALVESQLATLGYDPGAADGTFDSSSRRALRQFQTRQGLPVTGFVDQATVQALIVVSLR
jgi:peptidoglycan hydrolase-like protein with peptidoglycan-binding domain